MNRYIETIVTVIIINFYYFNMSSNNQEIPTFQSSINDPLPKRSCTVKVGVGSYNEKTMINDMLDRSKYDEFLQLRKKDPESKKVEKLTNFYCRTVFNTLLGKRIVRNTEPSLPTHPSKKKELDDNDTDHHSKLGPASPNY